MAPPRSSSSSSLLLLLFNGERAVVVVYVIQIVLSSPLSLLPQALSLSLLSLFALSVEISADHPLAKSSFTTRAGASSGILLGAVTLPGLMLSRLIQILRAAPLSLQHPQLQGVVAVALVWQRRLCFQLEYLKLLYWVGLGICISVLIFLCILCRDQEKNTHSTYSVFTWNVKFSYIFITLLIGFVLLLSPKLYDGLPVLNSSLPFLSLWVLCHGLAAVKLIQKILHMFPACASVGESLLVTTGLLIYFGDMLLYTVAKMPGYFALSKALSIQYGFNRSEIGTIIQGMIFGLLLFPVFFKYVLGMSEYFFSLGSNRVMQNQEMRRSFVFYASLTGMLVMVVPSWMQLVHSFYVHPLLWVFQFVFSEPLKRTALCAYWLVVICLSVRRFYYISKNSMTERILLRKYYHLMAVSIFVPALIFQPMFLNLAFGAALSVFLLLEIIRIWKIWPLGHLVHHFMNAFTDHRDSDLLIVSHFSLLLGCALPIWLSSGFTDRPLAPFAGILSLGIGDTMASMVGHKYGVLRWSKTGKKTIEGTAAGITSVLASCFLLLPLLAATGYIFTMHWFSLIVAVTTSGLLEAYTAQLDNAFIPLVFYSLLCL